MNLQVRGSDDDGLHMWAPLAANANPHGSLFGGSASAVAIVAGWSLVRLRLLALGLDPTLVIQRNTMEYEAPALGDVDALARYPHDDAWGRFLRAYRRHGRGRIAVEVELRVRGVRVASMTAWYVALDEDDVA